MWRSITFFIVSALSLKSYALVLEGRVANLEDMNSLQYNQLKSLTSDFEAFTSKIQDVEDMVKAFKC